MSDQRRRHPPPLRAMPQPATASISSPNSSRPNVINHYLRRRQVTASPPSPGHPDRVRALFPDQHFIVEGVVVNGDKAAARWTMTAINSGPIAGIPPTGTPITQHGVVFYRFEDGKIAEALAPGRPSRRLPADRRSRPRHTPRRPTKRR